MNSRLPRIAANTALILGSILFTLLLLEVSFRIMTAFDHNNLDTLMSKGDMPDTRKMRLGDIIRLHPDNMVVYELRPGTQGEFMGQPLSINTLGMRDKERKLEKEPGPPKTLSILSIVLPSKDVQQSFIASSGEQMTARWAKSSRWQTIVAYATSLFGA